MQINSKEIEKKWQKYWEEHETFKAIKKIHSMF